MKSCLDKSGFGIDDVKKILIHQANEKMDEAIIHRFYKLYGQNSTRRNYANEHSRSRKQQRGNRSNTL